MPWLLVAGCGRLGFDPFSAAGGSGDRRDGDPGADTGGTSDGTVDAPGDSGIGRGSVQSISSGGAHTCAVLDGGRVRCWGRNAQGQLGYGHTQAIGDSEPASAGGDVAIGGTTLAVETGEDHSCVLLDTREVRCWGSGNVGRTGHGNQVDIGDDEPPSSVAVVAVGAMVNQLAAGAAHTCALLVTGAVRCWGTGAAGRLGYGNTTSIGDTEPPSAAGDVMVGATVTQIVAGDQHTCALTTVGTVRCWGDASLGQLGYGDTVDIGDTEPPSAAGDVTLGGTAVALASGRNHVCALMTGGAVRCWGNNASGQLGYGNTTAIGDTEDPSSAGTVNIGGSAIAIAAGGNHTCALLSGGGVRCWGAADNGQLGYGNELVIGDGELPATAGTVMLTAGALRLSLGGAHSCAVVVGDHVQCWGAGGDGQQGHGNSADIGDTETPNVAGVVPLE